MVLIADHNRRNLELLGQFLNREGYQTVAASNLEELEQVIDQTDSIALSLVDISGFDRHIWQNCEQLRSKNIPLLILSPKHSMAIQQESVAHGARGVLIKPLVVKELLALVKRLIED
jgi:DNA-binding response OmpR family regulator